jgi:hypothetical protein
VASHHFVPAFLVANFASADAALCIADQGAQARVLALDAKRLSSRSERRKWPVVVWRKDERRLIRGTAEKVLCEENFYRYGDLTHPLLRGLLRRSRFYYQYGRFPPGNDLGSLLSLGKEPLNLDEVETAYTAPFDGGFAKLARQIDAGDGISSDEVRLVFRFLGVARARTPAWKESQGDAAFAGANRLAVEATRHLEESASETLGAYGLTLEDFNDAERSFTFQMLIVSMISGSFDIFGKDCPPGVSMKLLILRGDGSVPFVLSDNPMRNFHPARLDQILLDAEPGLREAGVMAVHPISPQTALVVHSTRGRPLCEKRAVGQRTIRLINTALLLGSRAELVLSARGVEYFERQTLQSIAPTMSVPAFE